MKVMNTSGSGFTHHHTEWDSAHLPKPLTVQPSEPKPSCISDTSRLSRTSFTPTRAPCRPPPGPRPQRPTHQYHQNRLSVTAGGGASTQLLRNGCQTSGELGSTQLEGLQSWFCWNTSDYREPAGLKLLITKRRSCSFQFVDRT